MILGYCRYGNKKWEVMRLGVGVTPANVSVAIVDTEEEAKRICREGKNIKSQERKGRIYTELQNGRD